MRLGSLLAALWVATAVVAAPVNVPPESEIYELFDRLDGYRCLQRTIRVVKPQTYADLRRGIFLPENRECHAPNWLLQKTRVLEGPSLRNMLGARAFLVQDDFLALPGIAAVTTPTFPLQGARPAVSGGNLLLEAQVGAAGGNTLGFGLGATAGWAGGWQDYDLLLGRFYLQDAYLKVFYQKIELSYGRIPYEFGSAKHGTLLLSQAARPIDMFRLTIRPSALGELGLIGFDTWIGSQGDDVAVANTRLWALALAYAPTDWLELGFLQLHQFGGTGAPGVGVSDLFSMLVFSADPAVANSTFSMHANLWLFDHYMKLYVQTVIRSLSERWGFLVGMYFARLGTVGLRLEYAETGSVEYTHPFWTQGLVNKGSPLGHPLGPDGRGVYADLLLPPFSGLDVSFGIRYEARLLAPSGGLSTEKRYGVGIEAKKTWDRYTLQAGAQYLRVGNHLFSPGVDQNVVAALIQGKYILF